MQRFERFAAQLLDGVELRDVPTLLRTLDDDELVRLLVGMSSVENPDQRLRRNVVGTELQNRLVRAQALFEETLAPPQERDFHRFTEAIARALRSEMACIDEVLPDDEFRLHGHYQLPQPVMETERCQVSSMAMCEHVLRSRQTLHVPDIARDARWRTAPAYTRHGLLHYTGAPGFNADGSVRCVLWVADRRPHPLGANELQLLQRLAQRVAEEFQHAQGDAPAAARVDAPPAAAPATASPTGASSA